MASSTPEVNYMQIGRIALRVMMTRMGGWEDMDGLQTVARTGTAINLKRQDSLGVRLGGNLRPTAGVPPSTYNTYHQWRGEGGEFSNFWIF